MCVYIEIHKEYGKTNPALYSGKDHFVERHSIYISFHTNVDL